MKSPTMPGGADPDPFGLHDPTPAIAHDVGPEVAQADAGAGRFLSGLFAGAVLGGRPAGATVDGPSPQLWPSRPSFTDAVATSAVGDETAAESLPGRLRPSTWDGEPSWAAALGGT